MSMRLRLEADRLRDRIERGDPYWPAQLAVAAAITLNLLLTERVTVGPSWMLPAVEGLLLVALIVVVPRRATAHSRGRRRFALAVIGVVSLAYVVSLGLLVHFLINGGAAGGRGLIVSGAVLWITNVLLFAVWYWEMDRGGPVTRFLDPHAPADFQYPQMENPQLAPEGWRPGFVDYLYTSFTNATAFSPTDTMPLTQTAKVVMGIQSVAALLTVGLVVARAVNILG
jgi:uncharacterized membrane protein